MDPLTEACILAACERVPDAARWKYLQGDDVSEGMKIIIPSLRGVSFQGPFYETLDDQLLVIFAGNDHSARRVRLEVHIAVDTTYAFRPRRPTYDTSISVVLVRLPPDDDPFTVRYVSHSPREGWHYADDELVHDYGPERDGSRAPIHSANPTMSHERRASAFIKGLVSFAQE